MQKEDVFLEGAYGYRTWRFLVVAIVLAGIGGTIMFLWVRSLQRHLTMGDLFAGSVSQVMSGLVMTIFFLGFALFMCSNAVLYFWKIVFGGTTSFRIDATGIRHGGRQWRWEQVVFVDAISAGIAQGVWIRFRVKRGIDRALPTGTPLPEDAYNQLRNRLSAFLRKHHPAVRLD